jgi:hypothetical protein
MSHLCGRRVRPSSSASSFQPTLSAASPQPRLPHQHAAHHHRYGSYRQQQQGQVPDSERGDDEAESHMTGDEAFGSTASQHQHQEEEGALLTAQRQEAREMSVSHWVAQRALEDAAAAQAQAHLSLMAAQQQQHAAHAHQQGQVARSGSLSQGMLQGPLPPIEEGTGEQQERLLSSTLTLLRNSMDLMAASGEQRHTAQGPACEWGRG